jgi:hypothetical protein
MEAGARLLQQGGSNRQVDLCVADVGVTKVRTQEGKPIQNVVPVSIPLEKPRDGEGSTKIM